MTKPHRGSFADSLRCALEGLHYVLRGERNARVHLLAAAAVVALGACLDLSGVEWGLMISAIALVFAGEMLNTVVELTVDLITMEDNPMAKHAKDVAAGAVLVASTAAAVMGLVILGPRLLSRLAGLVR